MSLSEQSETLLHSRVGIDPPPVVRLVAAAGSALGAVSLSLHDSLEAVEVEWRRFEETADCSVFQCFDWQSLWRKHIGARAHSQPAIVVGRERDRILFIFPLAIEHGRLARTLTWHAGDLCDYNGPLICPDFASVVDAPRFLGIFAEIRGMLGRDPRFAHDAVILDKMPDRLGAQANPFLALPTTLNASGAYAVRLTGEWESFYTERRSSATRRRDRTKRKRLGDIGEVRFVTPEDPAGIAASFNALVEQKTRQFQAVGVEDLFARPGFRDLFLELATSPATRHLAHVSQLEVGPLVAAANLGLVFRDHYYHVFASYDAAAPSARFGPGVAHLHDLLRYAIDRKCGVFDFTIGDEPYKREWADIIVTLHDYRAATTLLGAVTMAPGAVIARAKRFIKQTPALWTIARKARSLLALLRGAGRRAEAPAGSREERDDA